MTARSKQDAARRVRRGGPPATVAPGSRVTVADPSAWRHALLEAEVGSLKSRPRTDREGRDPAPYSVP